MKKIENILSYLDKNEIDYRLESNFCCGYVFYFLDGSIYPRRYYDYELEKQRVEIAAESVEHIIEKACGMELKKDWRHRIEGQSLEDTFNEVEKHLIEHYQYQPTNQ